MEINALTAVLGLIILCVGPGSGVFLAIRYGEKSTDEVKVIMRGILAELRTLNHRVTKSEVRVEGLEKREEDDG